MSIILFKEIGGLEKDRFVWGGTTSNLLGAGVLGDSLGTLRNGMLGKLTREKETDSSLDFARGDGRPLVVVGKTGSLSSNALKDVIDKGVHDAHGLGADASVRVDLLEDLVDVDGIGLLSLAVLGLLITLGDSLGGLASLLDSLSWSLGGHVDSSEVVIQLMLTKRFALLLLQSHGSKQTQEWIKHFPLFSLFNFGAKYFFVEYHQIYLTYNLTNYNDNIYHVIVIKKKSILKILKMFKKNIIWS